MGKKYIIEITVHEISDTDTSSEEKYRMTQVCGKEVIGDVVEGMATECAQELES